MRKIFCSLVFLALTTATFAQVWYERNVGLRSIFASNVWTCIEKARQYYNSGNYEIADKYLRKAEQLTLVAEPFGPKNWPSHWPRTQEALDILRYASPIAYIYRIFADYAIDRGRSKEAIRYIKMYLDRSYIPDAEYMFKLGNLFESEGLIPQAIAIYQELLGCIQSRNFHNNVPSQYNIQHRIRILNAKIEPQVVLVLDMKLQNLPNFLSNAGNIFKEKMSSIDKVYTVVNDQVLDKILAEQKLTRQDILDDLDERDKVVKILNVRYILEPSLVNIENMYIFQVRVYRAGDREPVEIYEYRNENYEFLPNYFQRFVLEFQDKKIPEELLIPENSYRWAYEATDEVLSIAISRSGNSIVAGCRDGKVYLLSQNGSVRRTFKEQDEIVKVAISPDGLYSAWASLDGKICLAEGTKVIYQKKIGNLVRAISIGENGKFWVYAVNEKIYYLDSKGEVFWNQSLPDWVSSLRISQDCAWVSAGTVSGEFFLYNSEGNLAWSRKLGSQIENIRYSHSIEYVSAGLKNNLVYVFSINGNEIIKFTLGDNVRFLTFDQNLIESVIGIWNQWYYFTDRGRKKIWYYSIDKSVKNGDTAIATNFYVLTKGKSLLAYNVNWK
ncbi:MAG TPA: hypothetical protein PK354_06460 [bacterium]|nr:hypothetical protein [bacterium]